MRKIIFIMLCFLPLAGSFAQSKGAYYHSRIGIGQSMFRSNSNIPDQSGKVALNLGFGGTYQFFDNLGISAEALFSSKGTRVRGTEPRTLPGSDQRFEDTYRLFYAEIPVLLKVSIGLTDDLYLKIFAGPSFNFNLLGTYTRDYDNPNESDIQDKKINGLNTTEQSLVYGAGLDVMARSGGMYSIDFRVNNAMTKFGNIYDQNNNLIGGYNNYFSIGLGYSF